MNKENINYRVKDKEQCKNRVWVIQFCQILITIIQDLCLNILISIINHRVPFFQDHILQNQMLQINKTQLIIQMMEKL